MNRKWSIYLGEYSGIKVYIHWTFIILIGWIFLMQSQTERGISGGLWGVSFVLVLFGCVLLHEFGHALTAKRYKIRTRDITLYPIGGIASLEAMPENPRQELLVAVAGPAVNLVIAVILFIIMSATGSLPGWQALKSITFMWQLSFLFNLFVANLGLALFNLIPAFPMDGGRILRAILAFRMPRSQATRVAAGIGQVLAMVFVFFGFFYNFWLVFIGLFVYLGASTEAAYEATRHVLAGYTVHDVLMTRFTALSPGDNLEKAVQVLLDGQEQDFLVMDDGRVQGILMRKDLIKGLAAQGKASPVSGIMCRDFMTLTPDMNLQKVYASMMTNACSAYPVEENGVLVGMVDKENISEFILLKQALQS